MTERPWILDLNSEQVTPDDATERVAPITNEELDTLRGCGNVRVGGLIVESLIARTDAVEAQVAVLTAERDRLVKKDAIWAAAFIKAEAKVATLTDERDALLGAVQTWVGANHDDNHEDGWCPICPLVAAITVHDATLAALSEGGEP